MSKKTTEQEKKNISDDPSEGLIKVNKLNQSEKLKALLSLFKKEDNVLIVIVADPDSMASAFAMKRILSRRVNEITICYPNEIKRVNNIAMKDLLKIPLQKWKSIKKENFNKKILIDSQPSHNEEICKYCYDAVIDHHPVTQGWSAQFIDIRPDYGAVSSMMVEYLKAAKIKTSVYLATALCYGIKVDSQNFTKKSIYQDVLAFQYIFNHVNKQLLKKIEIADIKRDELRYFLFAIDNLKISKNRIYIHLGKVKNPDILVVLADFFTHVYEIGWVIVSGFYNDKLIVIFRSDGYRKDAGLLAQEVFGNMGFAGGHKQSARAEIAISNFPDEDIVLKFTTSTLQKYITKHLN
jgi:nanoRNase/pAp phosphatase (c-di-AMP/oligoRNAs hydrolase)